MKWSELVHVLNEGHFKVNLWNLERDLLADVGNGLTLVHKVVEDGVASWEDTQREQLEILQIYLLYVHLVLYQLLNHVPVDVGETHVSHKLVAAVVNVVVNTKHGVIQKVSGVSHLHCFVHICHSLYILLL